MSPLRSILLSSFYWLLMITTSFAAPTSTGSTQQEEATYLWEQGQTAMQEGNYLQASQLLERLVHRYPAYPGTLRTRLLLGQTYFELKKFSQAADEFQNFIKNSEATHLATEARLGLIKTCLKLKDYHRALLTVLEIEDPRLTPAPPSESLTEATLLKGEALLGLKHLRRSRIALETAQNTEVKNWKHPLQVHFYDLSLRLKLSECAELPSPGRLQENQIREQLIRRGQCLQEGFLIFRKLLELGPSTAVSEATPLFTDHFKSYLKSCRRKYAPPQKPGMQKTADQLQEYHQELRKKLNQECQGQVLEALQLSQDWKLQDPSTQSILAQLTTTLKELADGGLAGKAQKKPNGIRD